MPEIQYATTEALGRVEHRVESKISELNNKVDSNSKSITRLETLYGTMVKLPDTIMALEKTVMEVNHCLSSMNQRITQINDNVESQRKMIQSVMDENKKQDEDIERVDNKSKVDWAHFLTNNFWGIITKAVVIIAALLVAYKAIAP